MKLHLDNNIVEGTPEELVEYLRLVEAEEEKPSTDIQVGDRVKVLESEGGAVGEATVTKVLEDGDVELAGKNKEGSYLSDWSNHVSNLEKIEDAPMGYTFWYIDGTRLRKHNVLEASSEGYFEDSIGKTYTYQAVGDLVKPIYNENAREAFERARDKRALLKYYPRLDMFEINY